MIRRHRYVITACVVTGIVCFVIGLVAGPLLTNQSTTSGASITRLGGYNYINPLLSCDISEGVPYASLDGVRQAIAQQINTARSQGNITRASVYFRDMDTGAWTGVNENDSYIPASLLKVPLMIAYLHEAETGDNVLQKYYALPTSDINKTEYFKPAQPLALGRAYSVGDLLKAMIEQSDNNAQAVLEQQVSTSSLKDVYDNFGIPAASSATSADMSPSEYMRVFRILYNATYLTRADSQQALALLSAIDFPQGAVRGLPPGIPFANKFGERTVEDAGGNALWRDLADCGIVYYPGHPYGICIMTEGSDFQKLADTIAAVSRAAYTQVDSGALSR